ncbi:MAG: MFS transporter [Pseudomonadales bacterium]|jgi:MFS family permease|nr:MFS transporter [Pseudomonadales bacterium]
MKDVGYLALLRRNPNYRRLWAADVASLFGDWCNTIAIYALIAAMTDSPLALGLVFIAKLLPNAIASPFAGLLVDRFDRRRLMIGADLLRAVIVCGFLFIGADDWVGWVYLLAMAQVTVSAVFQPARSAATPNVCTPDELATANALGAITWSTILTVGAGIGGVLTDLLGARNVFLIDAATYLVSAAFLSRTLIPQQTDAPGPGGVREVLRGIGAGVRYMRGHPSVGRIATAKALWTVGIGAIYYMFVIIAPTLAPEAPSTAIGVLYAAAGLGTGIGPIVVRALVPERLWPQALGIAMVVGGLVYVAFSQLPWVLAVVVLVVLAHSAGGANWVMSAVLLQRRTEDRYRGRVFANEMLMLALVNATTIAAASLVLEVGQLAPRDAVLTFALLQTGVGIGYFLWALASERRRDGPPAGAQGTP